MFPVTCAIRVYPTILAGWHPCPLDEIVRRHQSTSGYSRFASTINGRDRIRARFLKKPNLILDSGWDPAIPRPALAEGFPRPTVVGIDKSQARLTRAPVLPDNALPVRADLADSGAWRVLPAGNQAGIFCSIPIPGPKAVHVQRRWHGQPGISRSGGAGRKG